MANSGLVYLAGPITGVSYGGSTEWREDAIKLLAKHGITGLSPMRGKDYLADRTFMPDAADEYVLSTSKAIVTRDRWDCIRSDVVIVNLLGAERVSIGTMMELGWANGAGNPIILVMEPGNIHDHAMVREVAGYTTGSLDEALWIATVLLEVPNG